MNIYIEEIEGKNRRNNSYKIYTYLCIFNLWIFVCNCHLYIFYYRVVIPLVKQCYFTANVIAYN